MTMGFHSLMSFLFLGLFYIWISSAEQCPINWNYVAVQSPFNFDEYMGRWYEHSIYNPEEPPGSPKIWENVYFVFKKGPTNWAKGEIVGTLGKPGTCFVKNGRGNMRLEPIGNTPAKMKFIFTVSGKYDTFFYVISTDINTYAVIIECPVAEMVDGYCTGGTKISVHTRQPFLIKENKVRTVVDSLCHNFDNMYEIRHELDCPSSNGSGGNASVMT